MIKAGAACYTLCALTDPRRTLLDQTFAETSDELDKLEKVLKVYSNRYLPVATLSGYVAALVVCSWITISVF